jgi:D-alanyl-D-alanine dipeptidase
MGMVHDAIVAQGGQKGSWSANGHVVASLRSADRAAPDPAAASCWFLRSLGYRLVFFSMAATWSRVAWVHIQRPNGAVTRNHVVERRTHSYGRSTYASLRMRKCETGNQGQLRTFKKRLHNPPGE